MNLSEVIAHNERFRVPGQTKKPNDLGMGGDVSTVAQGADESKSPGSKCGRNPSTTPREGSQHSARPLRLRQDHGPKMNRLEAEWFAIIKGQYPNYPPVRSHAKTFVLANGVRYTPDFSASSWPYENGTQDAARETCWEVKGPQAWDDAIVKIKVAAHEWPEIHWIFCWKENGAWQQQNVLP